MPRNLRVRSGLCLTLLFLLSLPTVPFAEAQAQAVELVYLGLPSGEGLGKNAGTDYEIELLPGQRFTGYFYFWSTDSTLTADFRVDPTVPWLTLEASVLTSSGCADIQPIGFQFVAPMAPGFYTTSVEDVNKHWGRINVNLVVSPYPSKYTEEMMSVSRDSVSTLNETLLWSGITFSNNSCVQRYLPGPERAFENDVREGEGWMNVTPERSVVTSGDTVIVRRTFSSSVSGSFDALEVRTRQWTSLPQYVWWTLSVSETVNTETPEASPLVLSATPYPNPARGRVAFRLNLPTPGPAALGVYDLLGREVARVASAVLPAGEASLEWDAADLTAGVYLWKLRSGEAVATGRVVLAR